MKRQFYLALILAFICAPDLSFAQPAVKEFKVKQRYLNIPIDTEVDGKELLFTAKGVDSLSVDVCVAKGEPQYWIYKDLSQYMGKKLKITYGGDAADLE